MNYNNTNNKLDMTGCDQVSYLSFSKALAIITDSKLLIVDDRDFL